MSDLTHNVVGLRLGTMLPGSTDNGGPGIPVRETEGWWRYRAMIYFAVATLHFYRDEILPVTPQQTLGDFADANQELLDQIGREALQYFKYELSHEQIGRAIKAWLADPLPLPPAQSDGEGR